MIETTTLQFLKDLKKNNRREWFQENKPRYEAARENFAAFINRMIAGIARFDPAIAGLDAGNAIFRIYRDTRFSADKSPYKTNFGASMARGGKKIGTSSYYFHLEPGGHSFLAGGIYMPGGADLRVIRDAIAADVKTFRSILNAKRFVKYFEELHDTGDKLKTAPKGFPKDHPEIDLLKHKSYIVVYAVTDQALLEKGFDKTALGVYEAMKPLNDWLNGVLGR